MSKIQRLTDAVYSVYIPRLMDTTLTLPLFPIPGEHPLRRYRRIHNQMTQGQLAERLGCSLSMISHIEMGKRSCAPEKVITWEGLLNGEVTRHELRPDIYPDDPVVDRLPMAASFEG